MIESKNTVTETRKKNYRWRKEAVTDPTGIRSADVPRTSQLNSTVTALFEYLRGKTKTFLFPLVVFHILKFKSWAFWGHSVKLMWTSFHAMLKMIDLHVRILAFSCANINWAFAVASATHKTPLSKRLQAPAVSKYLVQKQFSAFLCAFLSRALLSCPHLQRFFGNH